VSGYPRRGKRPMQGHLLLLPRCLYKSMCVLNLAAPAPCPSSKKTMHAHTVKQLRTRPA
jgi:hypothetical protein